MMNSPFLPRFQSSPFMRLGSLMLMLIPALFAATAAPAQDGHWLTGYYATYNIGVMPAGQVDYTKLTHVIYWPIIPNAGKAGSATAPGTLYALPFGLTQSAFDTNADKLIAGAHAAGAKALLGIGGDAYSAATPDGTTATHGFQVSTTPTYQAAFISNIVALMQKYGFDGVDINWEQIQSSDNSDFTSFIANLRAALTAVSPNLLLTMPPETQENGGRPDLIAKVYQDLDQVNIQTYQMSGPYCGWETWYNSPLNNGGATFVFDTSEQLPSITGAISVYTSAPYNIPESKLGMGIQFDSEVWKGGAGTTTGGATAPKQTWTNDNSQTYCPTAANGYNPPVNPSAPTTGTLAYREMVALETTAGYTMTLDSVADQSWLSYDPSGTGTTNESKDEFISFDSPASIAKKGTDLSAGTGLGGSLGGVFIFELSGDYASSAAADAQHPLLDAANAMQNLLPGAVTGLTVTPATGSATLKWNAAPFATGYKVYYSKTSGSAGTLASTVTVGQATISNLTAGQKYYFQVQPLNAFGVATGGIATGSATIPGLVTPTITWATPASIPYGTPLTSTQLNATASVAGSFSYSAKVGAVLPVGANSVTATFTPSVADYSTATKTVTITVTAATLSTSDSFGTVNVGSWSDAHSIKLTYKGSTIAGSTISTEVLTMGAKGQDFAADSSSCTYDGSTSVHTCIVTLTFSPRAAGLRKGAVVMLENNTPLATAYISGIGSGPQIAFDPGTPVAVTFAGQTSPNGVAVDGSGNTYLADYVNKKVWKITPAGTYSAYVSGLSSAPYALAMDGAGNLFMSVSNTIVKVTQAGTQSKIGAGWDAVPKGIAVDGSGNVFVANTLANTVVKVTPAGTQSTVLSGTVLGKALNLPTGLAVDGSGNLYVSDSGNNRILKIPPSGSASVALGSGVSSPYGIAVSDTGNLYITDPGNNRILKLTPAGVQTTVLSGTVLSHALGASSIAVDGSENLYLSDAPNQRLLTINRALPALDFASTPIGSTSSDSPKILTVSNIGNASLNFPAPKSGTNASLSSASGGFTLSSSSTCPVLKTTSAAAKLAAGSSCSYALRFAPSSVGLDKAALTLTDNALNVVNARQALQMSGTGVALIPATVTLGGLSRTYTGSPIAATATTNPAGLAVSITYNGSATAPTGAGSYAVAAKVTTPGYSGSASGTLVISKATPVITWPTPAPIPYGTKLSATQLDATASVAGTFVYSPAAGTTPPVGTDTLSVTFTPNNATDYTTATAKVSLVVNPATAPPRVVWIPDFYGDLLQVRVGATNPTAITIDLPTCNPNSVAVNNNLLYVACSYDKWQNTNPDKILVYNASTVRSAAAGTLTISPEQVITSAQFSSLVGIAFDASNNLWIASAANSQVEMISAATLNTATPVVSVELVDSPDSPAGLAFASDGSLWVTGLDGSGQGILLNFAPSQFGLGEAANPSYCMASESGQGCQYVSGLFFNDPEGVALVNGDIWVADNSTGATGTTPGRELIDLKVTAAGTPTAMGTLAVNATFGNTAVAADSPFVCPGGLFATSIHLWVDDESYGEANPQCGANGDVASQTGGVFSFTPAQLAAKTTTVSQVLAFSNITGRPGFGGIFVENDR